MWWTQKKCGVIQLWIQNKSKGLCWTSEKPRIQSIGYRPNFPLFWEAFVATAQCFLSAFTFFASKSWQAWKPNFLSICQSRYWNSVSPDMRACNLPCLHEVTLIDLRLTENLKKEGFFILSRSFWISKSQKIFPDTDLLFFPLSLSFASLPQSKLKWNLFISGLCLSQKCSITERSTDFSWNSDYFETW